MVGRAEYIQTNQVNPVVKLMAETTSFWAQDRLKVTFPLFLRLGRVNPV